MQFSDWLTIILSLVGVLAGAAISWMFFRTQLLTDFRSLREKLLELNIPRDVNAVIYPQINELKSTLNNLLHKTESTKSNKKIDDMHYDIKEIKTMINLIEQIDNSKEIAAIKNSVEKLDKDLNASVREILHNVKVQQLELAERIQSTYNSQAMTAGNVVRDAFSSEVSKFVKDSVDREKLLTSLVNSFMEDMRVMGDYQKKNIEAETSSSINDIELKITNSIDKVIDEVGLLRNQLVSIPNNRT